MNSLISVTITRDATLTEVLEKPFQDFGFRNTVVRNSDDLEKIISRRHPHLIIWDYELLQGLNLQDVSPLLDRPVHNIIIYKTEQTPEEKWLSLPQIHQILEQPFTTWQFQKALNLAKTNILQSTAVQRLKTEKEQSQTYWEELLHSLSDAIFIINSEFEIEACNQPASDLLQIDESLLIHQNLQLFIEDGLNILNQVFQQLSQGYRMDELRVTIYPNAGKPQKVSLHIRLIRGTSPDLHKLIVILRDTTIHQQLLEQIERLTKLQTLKQFSGAIAHEIINPINILSGRLQLLKKEFGTGKSQKTFDIIEKQIERIAEVTNELNKFAVLKDNGILEKFSLIAFLERLVADFKKEGKLEVELKYPAGYREILIEANHYQLEDAFKYLLEVITNHKINQNKIQISVQKSRNTKQQACLEITFYFPNAIALETLLEPFQLFSTEDHLSSFGVAIMETIFSNFGVDMSIHQEPGNGKTLRLNFPITQSLKKQIKKKQKA